MRASEDAQVRGLLEVDTPVVTIYGKTSALHVREVLRCSPEENLEMIRDTVAFLKSHRREVVYDCEHAIDGWKDDPAYAIASMLAAVAGGADRVVLCDTNGGSLPAEVAAATRAAIAALKKTPVGIHTHDDAGLGLANALASLEAGASHVQGTVNGIGERTGNCDLTAVIPCAQLKFCCLRPQGRHARRRRPQVLRRLRAHRPDRHRQRAHRARQRPVRPQQHRT